MQLLTPKDFFPLIPRGTTPVCSCEYQAATLVYQVLGVGWVCVCDSKITNLQPQILRKKGPGLPGWLDHSLAALCVCIYVWNLMFSTPVLEHGVVAMQLASLPVLWTLPHCINAE